jgi:SUN domain-containing protein 1/2
LLVCGPESGPEWPSPADGRSLPADVPAPGHDRARADVESDHSAQYQYSHRSGVCQDGPVGWKCLGSFTYNIHGSNHQQTFDLDAQSSVPVNKVMLRVLSNWGADHTCMYRARLHGRDAVEDYQYDTRLNDPAE